MERTMVITSPSSSVQLRWTEGEEAREKRERTRLMRDEYEGGGERASWRRRVVVE